MSAAPNILPWIILCLAAGFVLVRQFRGKAAKRQAQGDGGGDFASADCGNGDHSSEHAGDGDGGGGGGGDGGGGDGGGD